MKKPIVSPYPKYLQKDPIFNGMPNYLKDPKNFEKIFKAIYEAGGSTCTHSEVAEYAACFKCQTKLRDRVELMRKLGFRSGQQYLQWVKVHSRIKDMQAGKITPKGEYYNS